MDIRFFGAFSFIMRYINIIVFCVELIKLVRTKTIDKQYLHYIAMAIWIPYSIILMFIASNRCICGYPYFNIFVVYFSYISFYCTIFALNTLLKNKIFDKKSLIIFICLVIIEIIVLILFFNIFPQHDYHSLEHLDL